MIELTSKDLILALSRSEKPIKQFSVDGNLIAKISPNQALFLAKMAAHVGEVRGRNARVRTIRPIEAPRVITDAFPGRPVLWTIGYERRSVGGGAAAA